MKYLRNWSDSYILIFFLLLSISAIGQKKKAKEQQAKGLSVGKKVADFKAIDHQADTFQLSKALEEGPVVLIFYRGQWCPVCNKHLKRLQDSLQLIYDKGATVIAISPEKSEYLAQTAEKTGVAFRLLHDEDYRISNQFDVTFLPDQKTRTLYNSMLGAKLKKAHSDDSERLPIPATFIINKKRVIVWRQFDPNYKNRSSVADILDNIPLK